MTLLASLLLAAPAPLPWIPPLRSRSVIEVPLQASRAEAVLGELAGQCRLRGMAATREETSHLECEYEADHASRLAFLTDEHEAGGMLRGAIRFSVLYRREGALLQAIRYAEYRVRGKPRQLLSEELGPVRELLAAAIPQP